MRATSVLRHTSLNVHSIGENQPTAGSSPVNTRKRGADRNQICRARAALAVKIQADRSLTHAFRSVALAILMDMHCATCRTLATYERIASRAGCDRSTVADALPEIERRYPEVFTIHRQRRMRPSRDGRRMVPARAPNLYLWRLDAFLPKSAPPTESIKPITSTHKALGRPVGPQFIEVSVNALELVIRLAEHSPRIVAPSLRALMPK